MPRTPEQGDSGNASGCRYLHTYQNPAAPQEFLLVQCWDSLVQQQGYIVRREA